MDRYERILTLHRLLKSAHYPIPLSRLLDELECSRATLYRDIAFLRDALRAPIESAGGEQAAFRYEVGEGEPDQRRTMSRHGWARPGHPGATVEIYSLDARLKAGHDRDGWRRRRHGRA